jgi:hypothetical protein
VRARGSEQRGEEGLVNQDDAKLTRQVLAPLREQPTPVTDAESLDARRQRLLPSIRAVVRKVPVRRAEHRWRSIVAVALPAVAAVALVVGAVATQWTQEPLPESPLAAPAPATLRLFAATGQVTFDVGNGTRTIAAGDVTSVPARGRIATGVGAEAQIESEGLEVTLRERTEVGVPEEGLRSLRMTKGGVRCVVPPLGPDRQFSVVTPDATVVVHGTVFSVRFDRSTKQSCVAVEEGVVSVRHAGGKTWLESGESWGCETTTAARETAPAQRPATPRPQRGTLEAENLLFQSALAADRRGDHATARAKLQELLAKYPESPLGPEARATLARLQKQ